MVSIDELKVSLIQSGDYVQLGLTEYREVVPRGGIEPPTRGFSVDSESDFSI